MKKVPVSVRIGWPEDQFLLRECLNYRKGENTEPDVLLFGVLVDWYIRNVPPRKLKGHEVAAMVDFALVHMNCSIAVASELIALELKDGRTTAAVVDAHKKKGWRKATVEEVRESRQARIK